RRSIGELSLLAAAVLVVGYLAFALDIFVTEGAVGAAQQALELDETLLLGSLLAVGLLAFAWRRVREVRAEIERRTASERAFRTLASEDPLTGLANRRKCIEALTTALAAPPGAGATHAFMLLDLNG